MSVRAVRRDLGLSPRDEANALSQHALGETLVEIFKANLALDSVAIGDDYFALGGDSINAVALISEALEWGVAIELPELFENPNIAALSKRLRARALAEGFAAERASTVTAIQAASRAGPLRLSFAQQRLWFLWMLDGPSATYNMQRAWRLQGELNRALLRRSLHEIISRHEALRTRFEEREGDPCQVIDPVREVTLREDVVADEVKARGIVKEEAGKPFDLTSMCRSPRPPQCKQHAWQQTC
jgi:aryl carrier-like protein